MAKLEFCMSLDSMVPDTMDQLIAPKISALTAPDAPDISASRVHLINAVISNAKFMLSISNKHRQLIFNIVRKTEDVMAEYCAAKENLCGYIETRNVTVSQYFEALRHFEHCLAHLYQAVLCMNALSKSWNGERQFEVGDGSILERVSLLHAAVKHMDDRFEKGKLGDENSFKLLSTKSDGAKGISDDDVHEIANVRMWLTNEGLEGVEAFVSYKELAQEILELSDEAWKLATFEFHRTKAGK